MENNSAPIVQNSQNAEGYVGDVSKKEVLGFIGDSITYGFPFPNNNAVIEMTRLLGSHYLYLNNGENGATTGSYIMQLLPFTLVDFKVYNVKTVFIMLGTNDARGFDHANVEEYISNMQSIISQLEEIGVTKIILNTPPNYENLDFPWSLSSRPRMQEFIAELYKLADNKLVFIGDKSAWDVFTPNWVTGKSSLLEDGLHPNIEGYKVLGELWYKAFREIISPAKQISQK